MENDNKSWEVGTPPHFDSEIKETWELLYHKSKKELLECGLGEWDDNLFLIPGKWHSFIPAGFRLIAIDGEEVIAGLDHIDEDVRFGYLAYGIMTELRDPGPGET
jgi:hypothetical protein